MPRQDTQYLDAHQDPWHYGALDHEIGGGLGQKVTYTDANGTHTVYLNGKDKNLKTVRAYAKSQGVADLRNFIGYVKINGKGYKVTETEPEILVQVPDDELPKRTGTAKIRSFPDFDAYEKSINEKRQNKPASKKNVDRKQVLNLLYVANGITENIKTTEAMQLIASKQRISLSNIQDHNHAVAAIRMIGSYVLSEHEGRVTTPETFETKFQLSTLPHISKDEWNSLFEHAANTFKKYKDKLTGVPHTAQILPRGRAPKSNAQSQSRGNSSKQGASVSRERPGSHAQSVVPNINSRRILSDKEFAKLLMKGRGKWTEAEKTAAAIKARHTDRVLNPLTTTGRPAATVHTGNNYNPGEIPLLSMRYPGEGMRL